MMSRDTLSWLRDLDFSAELYPLSEPCRFGLRLFRLPDSRDSLQIYVWILSSPLFRPLRRRFQSGEFRRLNRNPPQRPYRNHCPIYVEDNSKKSILINLIKLIKLAHFARQISMIEFLRMKIGHAQRNVTCKLHFRSPRQFSRLISQ